MLKYRLSNGITVILEQIPQTVSVSAGIWIKAGSRHESAQQYGYAHCIEHMLFKGTSSMSAKEMAREIDRVGGSHNAATNKEYTCYYVNLVADHAQLGISILADMYYNPLLDSAELEKEKQVIIEEINMYEDTADEHIHDIFTESMLMGHPLAHQILGTKESISTVSRESIVDFFNSFYCNDLTTVVVAGSFDIEEMKELLSRYFSVQGRTGIPPKQTAQAPQRVYRTHVERDLEQVHLCLGFEGYEKKNPKRWALYLLSTILGGSMSSRLFQTIREDQALCYSVYSFHSSYADRGIFGIYCGTSPDRYGKALDLICREVTRLLKDGVDDNELADAKTFMKGSLALSMESNEVRMAQLARDHLSYGECYNFDKVVENIFSVTKDEFMAVASELFDGKRATLVTIGPLGTVNDDPITIG